MPDLAISPDGRWAATGEPGAYAGQPAGQGLGRGHRSLVAQLPVGNARVAFSPDGRWLGVGGDGSLPILPDRLLDARGPRSRTSGGRHSLAAGVPSRQPGRRDPGRKRRRWCGSSRWRPAECWPRSSRPTKSPTNCVAFSPDGRHPRRRRRPTSGCTSGTSPLIRRRLDELGLAAGLPDIFGGNATSGDAPAVERIEVEGADPAGLELLAIRQDPATALVRASRAMVDPDLDDAEELLVRGGPMGAAGALAAGRGRLPSIAGTAVRTRTLRPICSPAASPPNRAATRRVRLSARPESPSCLTPTMCVTAISGCRLYRDGEFAEASAVLEPNTPQTPSAPASTGCTWRCAGSGSARRPGTDGPGRGYALAGRENRIAHGADRRVLHPSSRGGICARRSCFRICRRTSSNADNV